MRDDFSDYIVYVDESGDHGLENIDPDYPVFVLSFVIFEKLNYLDAAKAFQAFKFKHHGHDMVVLHENEIRRNKGDFQFLYTKEIKQTYVEELTQVMMNQQYTLVSCVIDKLALQNQYLTPFNPYDIATRACVDRVYNFLSEVAQQKKETYFVFESRGKKEDDELELSFRRICDRNNHAKKDLPFKIKIVHKQTNSTGLQIADLTARPIGLNYLKPNQQNRAFDVIKENFRTDGKGNCEGFGLVVFPKNKKPPR